ncbi:hypothetical protein BVY01_04800 [bacterium I07]|nr:hypothetical protein BVY01_04800 [bacterium I07]
MKRRDFLAASAAMGTMTLQRSPKPSMKNRQYLELLHIQPHVGSKKGKVSDFYRDVAIPALNRLGIESVGFFNVLFGPNQPSFYVLIPHQTMESVFMTRERMLHDEKFKREGKKFLGAELSDAAFVRMERSLLIAFKDMPKVESPKNLLKNKSRIYELRIYESHSRLAGKKKIEMFNEGGEIDIFKKTGLRPVFFAETLFGRLLPNLTYMLVFESMDARYKNWDEFRRHPDWLALKAKSEYKDTVSNITDFILRPAAFSQI